MPTSAALGFLVALVFFTPAVSAQDAATRTSRSGFWAAAGGGAGYGGSVECTWDCSGPVHNTAPSGYLRAGGTISQSVLVGMEMSGWFFPGRLDRQREGLDFVSAVLLWYPTRTSGFYLRPGIGLMRYHATDRDDGYTAKAPSASLGAGYEIRTGGYVSIVPYVNAYVSATARIELHPGNLTGLPYDPTPWRVSKQLVQVGVGITVH